MDIQATKSSTEKLKTTYKSVNQGIKQLYPAEDAQTTTNVDIVFVPGLGADPIDSWKLPEEKFNWASGKDGISKDYPNARILLYQHESAYRGSLKVEQFIDNLAQGLLYGLQGKRVPNEDDKGGLGGASIHKPLVFIGHSMGGLIIAKAITLMDSLRVDFPRMLEATVGCIFFGSPFRGAPAASIAAIFAGVAERFNMATSKLLELMKPDSTELRELRENFLRLAGDLSPKIEVFCFWEEQDTELAKSITQMIPAGSIFSKLIKATASLKIVDQESATFGRIGIRHLGLACNHSDLVKFKDSRHSRYGFVRDSMRKIIHNAPLNAKNRINSTRNIDLIVIKSLSEVLGGESVSRRRKFLERRFTKCTWLPAESEFLSWAAAGNKKAGDCLYIRGQQGRGKTAAMITALSQVDNLLASDKQTNSGESPAIVAYYFCDTQLESSAEDVLKSLLWQLIQKQYLFASYAKQFIKQEKERRGLPSSVENLWQSLQDMLTDLGSSSRIYFMVCNLHELPEDSMSTKKLLELIKDEMTTMNDNDVKRVPTRWFFTSRNDKIGIEDSFKVDGVRLVDLEDEKYADQVQLELRRRAKEKVAELGREKQYKRDLAYFVNSLIGTRADTTSWIDIICNQLKELPVTESANSVKQILKRLPKNLDTLLNDSWAEVFTSNPSRADDIKEMLRCLVLTYEDPTLTELAVLVGLDANTQGVDELRDLISRCPSFLKPVHGPNPKVAFKNPIMKPHLLRHIDHLLGLSEEEITWQHGELALRCFTHVLKSFNIPETGSKDESTTRSGSKGEDDDAQAIQQDSGTNDKHAVEEFEGEESDAGEDDEDDEDDDDGDDDDDDDENESEDEAHEQGCNR